MAVENSYRIWHFAYVRWYDNLAAGHRMRAAVWGAYADAICRLGIRV
jgi:hypothetical protein